MKVVVMSIADSTGEHVASPPSLTVQLTLPGRICRTSPCSCSVAGSENGNMAGCCKMVVSTVSRNHQDFWTMSVVGTIQSGLAQSLGNH